MPLCGRARHVLRLFDDVDFLPRRLGPAASAMSCVTHRGAHDRWNRADARLAETCDSQGNVHAGRRACIACIETRASARCPVPQPTYKIAKCEVVREPRRRSDLGSHRTVPLNGGSPSARRNGTTPCLPPSASPMVRWSRQCRPRHRHQEFLQPRSPSVPPCRRVCLDVDNYATHEHPKVRIRLAARPRFNITTRRPVRQG